jgi:hypothetical protein
MRTDIAINFHILQISHINTSYKFFHSDSEYLKKENVSFFSDVEMWNIDHFNGKNE